MSTSYRVEISANSRAGCTDTVCKKSAVKIQKNELRFGTWVEIPGSQYPASWKWKHWGCVSGKQLENLRDAIATGENEYDFSMIDGYDEMEGELADEYQEKIRTAMIEGKIADEDFKGDPKYNVLGQSGIRGRAPKTPKAKPGEEDEQQEQGEDGQASSAKAPASKKRGRGKKAADDEDDEDVPPTKKAKATGGKKKATKAAVDEAAAEPEIEQPRKKGQPKKVKEQPKVESEDGDELAAAPEKPKRKPRGTKAKKAEPEVDETDELEAEPEKPKRKSRAKKAAKVESDEEANGDAAEAEVDEQAAAPEKKRKPRAKKAAKAKVEDVPESTVDEENADPEPVEEAEAEPEAAPKAAGRKKRGKKTA